MLPLVTAPCSDDICAVCLHLCLFLRQSAFGEGSAGQAFVVFMVLIVQLAAMVVNVLLLVIGRCSQRHVWARGLCRQWRFWPSHGLHRLMAAAGTAAAAAAAAATAAAEAAICLLNCSVTRSRSALS
jgi:hypothetical protein